MSVLPFFFDAEQILSVFIAIRSAGCCDMAVFCKIFLCSRINVSCFLLPLRLNSDKEFLIPFKMKFKEFGNRVMAGNAKCSVVAFTPMYFVVDIYFL